jgi:hypothetical protein
MRILIIDKNVDDPIVRKIHGVIGKSHSAISVDLAGSMDNITSLLASFEYDLIVSGVTYRDEKTLEKLPIAIQSEIQRHFPVGEIDTIARKERLRHNLHIPVVVIQDSQMDKKPWIDGFKKNRMNVSGFLYRTDINDPDFENEIANVVNNGLLQPRNTEVPGR